MSCRLRGSRGRPRPRMHCGRGPGGGGRIIMANRSGCARRRGAIPRHALHRPDPAPTLYLLDPNTHTGIPTPPPTWRRCWSASAPRARAPGMPPWRGRGWSGKGTRPQRRGTSSDMQSEPRVPGRKGVCRMSDGAFFPTRRCRDCRWAEGLGLWPRAKAVARWKHPPSKHTSAQP